MPKIMSAKFSPLFFNYLYMNIEYRFYTTTRLTIVQLSTNYVTEMRPEVHVEPGSPLVATKPL